jgi:hypothetical protein
MQSAECRLETGEESRRQGTKLQTAKSGAKTPCKAGRKGESKAPGEAESNAER